MTEQKPKLLLPNRLEKICGIIFMAGMLATPILALKTGYSKYTIASGVVAFAAGVGAFKREDKFIESHRKMMQYYERQHTFKPYKS